MPLGKTPILQNNLMAEGDNQKFLLFNDALVALEDAANRALPVDLTSGNVTLTETQTLRFAVFSCSGHTVGRTLTIPATVGSPAVDTNRKVAVRNEGTGAVTVTHANSGAEVVIPSGETGLLYGDGTDIISLGGVSNAATIPLSDNGVEVVSALLSLNIAGNGFTITAPGAGAGVVTFDTPEAFLDLTDTPSAYTTNAGKVLAVNVTEDGVEFIDSPAMTDADVKTAYENNADTNAFTDAEKTKLAGIEGSLFKGTYVNTTALDVAHPAPEAGSFAYVDAGVGVDIVLYIWDADDAAWVSGGGAGSTETAASIKTKYESNTDTNAFTDAEKAKLAGIETAATADQTGTEIVAAIDTELASTDWRTGSGGGGGTITAQARFYGARKSIPTVSANVPTAWTVIPSSAASSDPYGFDSTNSFVIPAGVTKVRFRAHIASTTANINNQWAVHKNGTILTVSGDGGIRSEIETGGYNNGGESMVTAVLDVVESDVLDLRYFNAVTQSYTGWIEIEAIEHTLDQTSIPSPELGDAGKVLGVTADETGYELINVQMVQTELTASHVVTNGDLAGSVVRRMNLASAGTVTVNTGLTGTEPVTFIQTGAGQITFVAGAGVTIESADSNLLTRVRYSSATLIPDADTAGTYYLVGDLTT